MGSHIEVSSRTLKLLQYEVIVPKGEGNSIEVTLAYPSLYLSIISSAHFHG